MPNRKKSKTDEIILEDLHDHLLEMQKQMLKVGKDNVNILKQLKKIMAKQETFDALIVRLNAATNEIAADLQKLRDEIAAGADTISDESLTNLDSNIAALEAMGADPVNPVPVDPPVENA